MHDRRQAPNPLDRAAQGRVRDLFVCAALTVVVSCGVCFGDQPAAAKTSATEFECRWAEQPITIDGKADDADWQRAAVIEQFLLPWLKDDARPPRTATKARLLWDREYLYFFADMDDTDLYADVTEHDGVTWENDVFELFFKPADDKPGYYEFQVNAAGTVLDMFIPRRGAGGFGRFKKDGDFHLDAKVQLRGTLNKWTDKDQGWSVEGRIPWRDFLRTGGRPNSDERWKFVLCRYDYSVDFEGPELSWCSPHSSQPRADFHRFEDYVTLRFVGPPAKSAARPYGIESRPPLTTSRVVGSPDPPSPYRTKKAFPNLKLDHPIAAQLIPGSRWWLVITQPQAYTPSTLVRMRDDPEVAEAETLLSVPNHTAYSITFHPRFAENGYVFIGSNGPGSAGFTGKTTKITRYAINPKTSDFDVASAKIILEWESDGHNGGDTCFGSDGMLYVTSGDGTSDSDTNLRGQELTHLTAKVLRIDLDHPDAGREYSVPRDNPFVGQPNVRPETWCYGLRNPWRITADRKTGQIWVGNNGQDLWEQAYLIQRGANYGWSVMEGGHPFYLDRKPGPTPISPPTVDHPHSEFRSLTGGVVYHGERLPELRGAYIYGDHSTGKIWGVRHDGQKIVWHKELVDTAFHIPGFTLDARGEVLVLDHAGGGQGNLYFLEPTPPAAPDAPPFPRTLSASGLFEVVRGHRMKPGVIPYSVNAQLWSDGAHKERWLAIPQTADKDRPIEMTANRGWNFPDETVLVKSFALEMEAGKPASRRCIETRFLTKQQGEWFGYSYIWNDEQTDAMLVESAGLDREFSIRVPATAAQPASDRVQKWHYPSRTECMVCHSRAANYVLGLTTLQMNKEHDYGGVVDQQLRVLEHLGLLRVSWQADTVAAWRDELKSQGKTEQEIDGAVQRLTATRDQRSVPATSLLAHSPPKYPRLVDPYDKSQDLAARARSYLHANCSQCHVEAGGGNSQFQLEFSTPLDKMNLVDAPPLHHKFELPAPRLVAPGHPERSVLLARISRRGPGQMPQLATDVLDRDAIQLLHDWIKSLPEPKP